MEPGTLYRHYKGGMYEIVTLARLESDGINGPLHVVYRSVTDKTVWVRPLAEFRGNVFPEGTAVPRFTRA